MTTSYFELYDEARRKLFQLMDGDEDARQLLLYAFGISMNTLLLHFTEKFEENERTRYFREIVERRAGHEPLQYITGVQNFFGLDFKVNENVLIPRQDTEVLVEKILTENTGKDLRVLDLCTGSGCIAVTLKKLGGYAEVTGSDISRDALLIADENARENDADITFYESDMFGQMKDAGRFDLIVSNPPYIRRAVLETLMPEVRDHEPRIALDGDADGLAFYRIIAEEARGFLTGSGRLYLEIGFDQAADVRRILEEKGYRNLEITKDLSQLDRIVRADV